MTGSAFPYQNRMPRVGKPLLLASRGRHQEIRDAFASQQG